MMTWANFMAILYPHSSICVYWIRQYKHCSSYTHHYHFTLIFYALVFQFCCVCSRRLKILIFRLLLFVFFGLISRIEINHAIELSVFSANIVTFFLVCDVRGKIQKINTERGIKIDNEWRRTGYRYWKWCKSTKQHQATPFHLQMEFVCANFDEIFLCVVVYFLLSVVATSSSLIFGCCAVHFIELCVFFPVSLGWYWFGWTKSIEKCSVTVFKSGRLEKTNWHGNKMNIVFVKANTIRKQNNVDWSAITTTITYAIECQKFVPNSILCFSFFVYCDLLWCVFTFCVLCLWIRFQFSSLSFFLLIRNNFDAHIKIYIPCFRNL